jgi:hypothetical protein
MKSVSKIYVFAALLISMTSSCESGKKDKVNHEQESSSPSKNDTSNTNGTTGAGNEPSQPH